MAVVEYWLSQDLSKPVIVQRMAGSYFTEDNVGNLIGVKCTKDGENVSLSGTVSAYVIRGDDQTVTVANGVIDGNKASVLIPAVALEVPGPIAIVLRLTDGTTKTTLCAIQTTVIRSRTDTVLTPSGQTIYGIDEMLAQIAACETATTEATSAASAANSAATLANEKATLANTKASLANEMATAANVASTAANTQANRAKGYADAFGNVTTVTGLAGTQASVVIDTENGSATFTIPRGVDGTGAVSTVEGISPDANHNVSLDSLLATDTQVVDDVDSLFE